MRPKAITPSPVVVSQTFSPPRSSPVAIRSPIGENATLTHPSVLMIANVRSSLPSDRLNTLAVLSADPVRINFPSALAGDALDRSLVDRWRSASLSVFAVMCAPEPDGSVVPAGDDCLAIGSNHGRSGLRSLVTSEHERPRFRRTSFGFPECAEFSWRGSIFFLPTRRLVTSIQTAIRQNTAKSSTAALCHLRDKTLAAVERHQASERFHRCRRSRATGPAGHDRNRRHGRRTCNSFAAACHRRGSSPVSSCPGLPNGGDHHQLRSPSRASVRCGPPTPQERSPGGRPDRDDLVAPAASNGPSGLYRTDWIRSLWPPSETISSPESTSYTCTRLRGQPRRGHRPASCPRR